MLGLMQEWPLLCHKLIDYAAAQHGKREVITRSVEGPIVRTNISRYTGVLNALPKHWKPKGFSWETALPHWGGTLPVIWNAGMEYMGIGAVYHTLNPRLFPQQIAWIMNHAEDKAIFVDLTFLPIIEAIAASVSTLKKVIVLTDRDHMPKDSKLDLVCYEEWIMQGSGEFEWKTFEENTACGMCYTSGTTGDPKGVLYSHRSNVLHALIASMPDALGLALTKLSCR